MLTYLNSKRLLAMIIVPGSFMLGASVLADGREDSGQLLDKSEYRSELEEVVVVGREPEWRKPPVDDQEWRPKRFEVVEPGNRGRMEWFPEYTKEDRENYQGVRDRTGEKPEFKVFEWKF